MDGRKVGEERLLALNNPERIRVKRQTMAAHWPK